MLEKLAQQHLATSGVQRDSTTYQSLADEQFSLLPAHSIPLLQSIRNGSMDSEMLPQLLLPTEHTDIN